MPIPERLVEVDAARLLLVVNHFARPVEEADTHLSCWPARAVARVLTPEYYLQKLDFLVRYPAYLAYELIELHRMGEPSAHDGEEVQRHVRAVIEDREPDLRTDPFTRFWRGAYESLDRVEGWWHARELVYTGFQPRGPEGSTATRQKYFFLTPKGEATARRLVDEVDHAAWYHERIALIYRYYGRLTPAQVKALQYRHVQYREAQLNELMPDLDPAEIRRNFADTFGAPLEELHERT
jgi:hypothetical protein